MSNVCYLVKTVLLVTVQWTRRRGRPPKRWTSGMDWSYYVKQWKWPKIEKRFESLLDHGKTERIQACLSATDGPQCTVTGFPNFTFTFSQTEQFTSCDLERLPMNSNYEYDRDRIKKNQRAKYLGQRSFRKLSSEHTDTHTHNWPILLYLDH